MSRKGLEETFRVDGHTSYLRGDLVTQVCAFVQTEQIYTYSFYEVLRQKYWEGSLVISPLCLEMHEKIRWNNRWTDGCIWDKKVEQNEDGEYMGVHYEILSTLLYVWIFFFFFFLVLFRAASSAYGGSRLGVQLELQLWAYTIANGNASSLTHNLMIPSRICFHCATMGTPENLHNKMLV